MNSARETHTADDSGLLSYGFNKVIQFDLFGSVITRGQGGFLPTVPYWLGTEVGSIAINPIARFALPLPSQLISSCSGKNKSLLHKISWLAPTMGISFVTLVGRVIYDHFSNSFLQGAVFSLHTFCIGVLTNPQFSKSFGLISLRDVFEQWLGIPEKVKTLDSARVKSLDFMSERISAVTFITASLALTFFAGFHVITAALVAHTLAAAVKVVAMRIGIASAEQNNAAPNNAPPTEEVNTTPPPRRAEVAVEKIREIGPSEIDLNT